MRPVTAGFLRAVSSSHTMRARARIVDPGQTGVDPDGTETPILAGDVELDASAKVRGTLDLTTLAEWPLGDTPAALAPFGTELYIERGVQYGNGITEWCGLGYFRLESVEQDDAPAGALRLAGSDRMAGLEDARLVRPAQFTAGTTTYGSVVEQLVSDVYPGAVIEWDDTTETDTLGRSVIAEQDRHKFLDELITSVGKVWWWDHRGVLVIRDVPDVAAPVAEVTGGPGGVLVELSRKLTRKGTYNGVVVTGEAPGDAAPVSAVVVDADPLSPTYWDGPFGPVPRFYTSPLITTSPQAIKAGRAMLSQALGLPYSVDFSAVPNPALEPLDPVSIGLAGEARTFVLESLTIGLTPDDPVEATTREQTYQSLEVAYGE